MTNIRQTGRYLDLDADGHIISDARLAKIQPPWSDAVERARQIYVELFGSGLHSLYLRGSVPRGTAIEGISDLDMFAVLHHEADDACKQTIGRQKQKMEHFRDSFPFVKCVELSHTTLADVHSSFHYYRFVIKVSTVCIRGQDLALEIEPYKTDAPIAEEWFRIFPNLVDQCVHVLTNEIVEDKLRLECNCIMKAFLRAGMLLVMRRKVAYSRDLYPSYRSFSEYYPQYAHSMRKCLVLAIDPVADPEILLPIVRNFTEVISQLYEAEFGPLERLPASLLR